MLLLTLRSHSLDWDIVSLGNLQPEGIQGYRTNPVHLSTIKQVQIWTYSFPWWWPHEHLATLLSSDTVFFRHFELFLPPLILKPSLACMRLLFLSHSVSLVRLFATPWTAARQVSLFFTISQSLLKLMSIESVMPSNYLIPSTPSPPAFNLTQQQGLFQLVSSLHQVAKVLELRFQHHSFQWIFRVDFP